MPRSPRPPSASRLAGWATGLATALVVAFVVLRLVGGPGLPWPWPTLVAFTPYVVIPAALLLVAAAVLRRWRQTAVAGLALVALLAVVVPRSVARDQPDTGPEARTVRVLSVNVFRDHADPVAVAAIIRLRRPDVVSLQEASPGWVRRLRQTEPGRQLTGYVGTPGTRWNDTSVLSRWPVERAASRLPSVFLSTMVRVPGGAPVPVIAAHPSPPVTTERARRWVDWLGSLPGPSAALEGGLITGDFNATLDHPELRRILSTGWRDAAREAGSGLEPTWHGRRGVWLSLDHVLVPPGAAVRGYAVDRLAGSDHRAITAVVELPG